MRGSVTVAPGVFSPERLITALVWLRDDLLAHLLPIRRLRGQPRVVKRKMSNFGVKKGAHRHCRQPTKPPAEAVNVQRAIPPDPNPTALRLDQPGSKAVVRLYLACEARAV